jgi:DNA-binding transcriptional ArsR family regulator
MNLSNQRTAIFAGVFAALANPTRLEIVQALCEAERTPSELADALGVSRPNLSQQLATLQRAGLVKRRRDGGHVLYAIVDPRLKEACGVIEDIVGRELSGRVGALGQETSQGTNGEP